MKANDSMGNARSCRTFNRLSRLTLFCASLALAAAGVRADQVVMKNGDRYTGSVLSMDAESVVIQSELLGKVTLPRGKTTLITVGSNAPAPFARPATPVKATLSNPPVASTNANFFGTVTLRSLGADTNLIQQVREQYLGAAGTEVNRRFDEMLSGLMNGKLTMDDLRAQAKSAVDQLRAFKKDLGGDDAGELDGYLTILENFLKEVAPPQGSAPEPGANSAGSRLKNDSETR